MKVFCIYHVIDFDGKSAGALVRMFYERQDIPVTLFGYDYGYEIPYDQIDKETIVVVVDCTPALQDALPNLKAEPLFKMRELAHSMIWLDHHGTSIEEVNNFAQYKFPIGTDSSSIFEGKRTTKFSGTELTWLWFFSSQPLKDALIAGTLEPSNVDYLLEVPRLIYLLGRYDIWDKTERSWNEIVEFQFGLRLLGELKPEDNESFVLWHQHIENTYGLFSEFEIRTVEKGRVVVANNAIQNKETISRLGYAVDLFLPFDAFEPIVIEKSPFKLFALNSAESGSALFESLEGQYDAFIAYRHDGTMWRASIYSFDPERCNAATICTRLGGGGHPGAAGFIWPEDKTLPFRPVKSEEL